MLKIPSMNPPEVNAYLQTTGARWSGLGAVVECGCWLGGGTARLVQGLIAAGYDRELHCYDRWQANGGEMKKARKSGVKFQNGDDILPHFLVNLAPYGVEIRANKGAIQEARWTEGPIEIFILDAAKQYEPFFKTLCAFGPHWIAGHTVVGFMDLKFYAKRSNPDSARYLHQRLFVEHYAGAFEVMRDNPDEEPAFYRYMGGIDFEALAREAL